ncbi:replication initiator protein [Microviridae sp.]|nr:replication initiator protein [Microviridae sp.]
MGIRERLDLYPLTHTPPHLAKMFRNLGSAEEHLSRVFGTVWKPHKRGRSAFVWKSLELARERSHGIRAASLAQKLELEIIDKVHRGWFVIMTTLTVRNDQMETVFGSTKAWTAYTNKVTTAVGVAVCGSRKKYKRSKIPNSELHTYCAVRERGENTGRLHVHVVHCVKKLPKNAIDPNARAYCAKNREVECMKAYWPHGMSSPIAVRYSPVDAYGRIGWLWPIEEIDGTYHPYVANPPRACAAYLADYLTKSYTEKERHQWRTKTSQKLGSTIILAAMSKMSRASLEIMATIEDPNQLPKVGSNHLSPSWMRALALPQSLPSNCGLEMKQSTKNLLSRLATLQPQKSLLQKLEARQSGNTTEESEPLRYIDIETRNMMTLAISDARAAIEEEFRIYNINQPFRHMVGRST